MTFREWMEKVNQFVLDELGCYCDDLPDMTYRDWYDSGMSPEEALDNIRDEL